MSACRAGVLGSRGGGRARGRCRVRVPRHGSCYQSGPCGKHEAPERQVPWRSVAKALPGITASAVLGQVRGPRTGTSIVPLCRGAVSEDQESGDSPLFLVSRRVRRGRTDSLKVGEWGRLRVCMGCPCPATRAPLQEPACFLPFNCVGIKPFTEFSCFGISVLPSWVHLILSTVPVFPKNPLPASRGLRSHSLDVPSSPASSPPGLRVCVSFLQH